MTTLLEIEFIEARLGDRRYSLANVEETFSKLNWKPNMDLETWIGNVTSK